MSGERARAVAFPCGCNSANGAILRMGVLVPMVILVSAGSDPVYIATTGRSGIGRVVFRRSNRVASDLAGSDRLVRYCYAILGSLPGA